MKMECVRIFGDSILRGVLYENGGYHLCHDRMNVPGVLLKNECRMGADSRKGLALAHRVAENCDRNTMALLEFGGNDCNYDWSRISDDPSLILDCTVPPEEYCRNLKEMAAVLSRTGAQVAICTLAPIDETQFMNYISRGLSYDNILQWLGTVHRLYEWQAYYSHLAEQTAKEIGCLLIDLRSAVDVQKRGELFCADGIHPTEPCHVLLHRYLENELEQLIAAG